MQLVIDNRNTEEVIDEMNNLLIELEMVLQSLVEDAKERDEDMGQMGWNDAIDALAKVRAYYREDRTSAWQDKLREAYLAGYRAEGQPSMHRTNLTFERWYQKRYGNKVVLPRAEQK